MNGCKLEVGAEIETWFSDNKSGKSRILSIRPLEDRYRGMFTHIVRVSAPRTRRGWMELSVHESDFQK
jgi:hypothetical protein